MSIDQKLNFDANMNRLVERRVEVALQKAGKMLPASVAKRSGNIVTVALGLRGIPYMLPQVTIPLFGPQYIRYPMQPGNREIIIPADTYLGGVSGQGGGIADLAPPANLSVLVFLSINNTEWEGVDGQIVIIYGPEGITIRDADSNTTFLLTPDSMAVTTPTQFKVTVGSTVFTLTDGMWNLTGQTRKLKGGIASTGPTVMCEGWKSFVPRYNSHVHPSENGGNNTENTTVQFNGNITK